MSPCTYGSMKTVSLNAPYSEKVSGNILSAGIMPMQMPPSEKYGLIVMPPNASPIPKLVCRIGEKRSSKSCRKFAVFPSPSIFNFDSAKISLENSVQILLARCSPFRCSFCSDISEYNISHFCIAVCIMPETAVFLPMAVSMSLFVIIENHLPISSFHC